MKRRPARRRAKAGTEGTKQMGGQTVLDHEGGTKFYHKHLSPRAKKKKKARRQMRKKSRR